MVPLIATKSNQDEIWTKTAILGAGPTGLGAAWQLAQDLPPGNMPSPEPGETLPFLLLDESPTPGGRAASFTTPEGFTFDYGGHVLFPHQEYIEFSELLEELVKEWHHSVPVRGVWINKTLIPTPVQRNIHRLPFTAMVSCLWGLWKRKPIAESLDEPTLHEYLESIFGTFLTRHVMGPLNKKMWAHSPETLGSRWSSHSSGSKERNIPDVRIRSVLRNLVFNKDEPGWTSTSTVRYPAQGGMGAIWNQVFDRIPKRYRRLAARIVKIDSGAKTLYLEDGCVVHYEKLLTSIPLDTLLRLISDQPILQSKASGFVAARAQLFGFGVRGPMPAFLKGLHALSIPSAEIPFWRINIPSNFSPGNAPHNMWSILCESSTATSSETFYDLEEIESLLRQIQFLPADCEVVSTFTSTIEHGYPVPFAGRDKLLNDVQKELEKLDIYSRGRFGGWRYEVSNQDHAFMQGVEVITRLKNDLPEYTYRKTW